MKKIFELPVVEVKNLTLQNDIMGIFNSNNASSAAEVSIFADDTVIPEETKDNFSYWSTK